MSKKLILTACVAFVACFVVGFQTSRGLDSDSVIVSEVEASQLVGGQCTGNAADTSVCISCGGCVKAVTAAHGGGAGTGTCGSNIGLNCGQIFCSMPPCSCYIAH